MRMSEKQIDLVLGSLKRRGYPIDTMTSKYRCLAKPGHCTGRVIDWLKRLTVAEASTVMERLS